MKESGMTIREYGAKGRATIQATRANGLNIRDYRESDGDHVDVVEYLERRKMEYIRNIEDLAESGTKEDLVKLKANHILLNKIIPDKTRHEIGLDSTSPMTILLAAIQQNQVLANPPPIVPIEDKTKIPLLPGK